MLDRQRVIEQAMKYGARETDRDAYLCDVCALFDEDKPADVEFDAPDGYFTGDNVGYLCVRCLATQGCYSNTGKLNKVMREHSVEEILAGVKLPMDVKWVLDTSLDDELDLMREQVQSRRSGGGSGYYSSRSGFGATTGPSEFARDVAARRKQEAEKTEESGENE